MRTSPSCCRSKQPIAREFRERFHLAPLEHGLYGLDIWARRLGKVLNIDWQTAGGAPHITTFRRGDWERRLMG